MGKSDVQQSQIERAGHPPTGTPLNLYQLKMYWDGLVVDKKQNLSEAMLMVEEFNANLEAMANMMNQMTPPSESNPYNFKIGKLKDHGLS